jgi:diguanylate cyclase (GGDEF)-like protein
MSAVQESLRRDPVQPAGTAQAESAARATRLYVGLLIAAAAAAGGSLYLHATAAEQSLPLFAALAAAAMIAQAFPVSGPKGAVYHTSVVFIVAAALLLPPQLLVLVPLVQTAPGWLRDRRTWVTQGFDIAGALLAALAAWGAATLVQRHAGVSPANARFAAAGVAACLVFLAVSRLLSAGFVRAGREGRERESALFSLDGLSVDLVLATLGISLAAFWRWDPWLLFAALAPLVVVHRSLSVPQLQEEARVDPKTGLYNARYFGTALTAELSRASRFDRPMAVIMADLDLLRDVNNAHGHLAGDAVLRGVADAFAAELRHYDVAARFGGEEFSIVLPETDHDQALEIAERIRRSVAEREFEVPTSPEPLRATLSLGVAVYPTHGLDADELVHQADLAVYRAKLQGRNRVLSASNEPLVVAPDRSRPAPTPTEPPSAVEEAASDDVALRPSRLAATRVFAACANVLAAGGLLAGALALVRGSHTDVLGLLAMIGFVGVGQVFSAELVDVGGSVSVGAVGSLAAASLFGYRAALPLAAASVLVEWSARHTPLRAALRDVGALTLGSLAAAGVFSLGLGHPGSGTLAHAALGIVAGAAYFVVIKALKSVWIAVERGVAPRRIFQERYAWLLPHYLVYGFIGAVVAAGYDAVGLYAFAVFALPLLLVRRSQDAYQRQTRRSSQELRAAAETIRAQNVSLEQANQLLRERSNAAMESLSATVDARDAYTAGRPAARSCARQRARALARGARAARSRRPLP